MLILAILSKSTALMLLPAIILGDVLLFKTPLLSLPRRHWHLGAIGVAWLVMSHSWLTRSVSHIARPMAWQLYTQSKAIGYYLLLLIMPVHQNVEPQFHLERQITAEGVLCVLLLATGLWVSWILMSNVGRWLLLTAGLWALPTTVMPLNVLVNERRGYMLTALACIGVGVLISTYTTTCNKRGTR